MMAVVSGQRAKLLVCIQQISHQAIGRWFNVGFDGGQALLDNGPTLNKDWAIVHLMFAWGRNKTLLSKDETLNKFCYKAGPALETSGPTLKQH